MQHIRGVAKRDILFYVVFSVTNLKMNRWYSFYYERVVIGQQLVGQLQMPESFGLVPWKHHVLIISKCQTIDEALFFINIMQKRDGAVADLKANWRPICIKAKVQPLRTLTIHCPIHRTITLNQGTGFLFPSVGQSFGVKYRMESNL